MRHSSPGCRGSLQHGEATGILLLQSFTAELPWKELP